MTEEQVKDETIDAMMPNYLENAQHAIRGLAARLNGHVTRVVVKGYLYDKMKAKADAADRSFDRMETCGLRFREIEILSAAGDDEEMLRIARSLGIEFMAKLEREYNSRRCALFASAKESTTPVL